MRNKSNNVVTLSGEIHSDFVYDHTTKNEKFYKVYLKVNRLSGKFDTIPLLVSERIIDTSYNLIGLYAKVKGSYRSYNDNSGEKSRLILYVFVDNMELIDRQDEDINRIELNSYISCDPRYRKTPMGREITDVILAANRDYGRSDYIPTIFWGRDARFVESLPVGTNIRVIGRIQSREYDKKLTDDIVEVRTAYEVSIREILYTKEPDWLN